jgi:hypothetical protein
VSSSVLPPDFPLLASLTQEAAQFNAALLQGGGGGGIGQEVGAWAKAFEAWCRGVGEAGGEGEEALGQRLLEEVEGVSALHTRLQPLPTPSFLSHPVLLAMRK